MADEFITYPIEDDIIVSRSLNESTVSINVNEVNSTEQTIDVYPIDEINQFNIVAQDAFAAAGEPNEQLRHTLLTERDAADQHPISAIIGLEPRLSNLETLGQVRATGENVAHYYMWNNTNDSGVGYFVSFVQNSDHIQKSNTNIIGVTISPTEAAFVGNEVVGGRGASYGLVCTSGRVRVRASQGVSIGDKVIPASGGIAQKSDNDYGYKVINTENDSGVFYAIICIVPPVMGLYELSDDIADMEDRLDIDEANIVAAINTANIALQNVGTTASQVAGQISTLQGQVQTALDAANDASDEASSASLVAALASEIATAAQTTAESIQTQVATDISDMEDDIQDLIDSVEPIVTWDGTNGTTGASYLIDHIQNDLATKTEVSTVDTRVDNAFTAIQTNAKTIQTMAMIERKYTVGPHSPVYGLSYEYAEDMIPVGMIYVPTVNVTDTTEDGNHSFTFYSGNSYEWDGTGWIAHSDDTILSSTYATGNSQIKYWYVGSSDVTHNNITYPAGSLCLWNDGIWVVVANIKDYGNFHITSRLYQTADELGAEIANAQGDIVSLNTRITNDESQITALATQQGTQSNTIALIQANASETNARIDSIVMYDGNVLMQTLVLGSTPSGQFYTTEPTWDNDEGEWSFSNTYTTVPSSPCWAKVSGDDTKYYKYTVGANNVWTRETYKYITSLAGVQQQVSDNESSINSIVSNIGSNGVVNAASIIQKVNADSSEIQMSADRIKLSGGTINLATGQFQITANNGFVLDQNGISWTTASSPVKMVYSTVNTNAKPANNTLYSSFPDSGTTAWHKNITANDKYASETTDGGATWSAIRQIVGADGATGANGTSVSISSTSVTYQASSSGTTTPTGSWSSSVPSVSNGQYLWTKTVVNYSNGSSTTAYSVAYKGTNGTNGTNGTSVSISSTSVTYQASSSGTTTPTGSWSSSVPSVSKGQYLWTRTIVNYSNGTSTTSYSVSYYGTDANMTKQNTFNALFGVNSSAGITQGLQADANGNVYINASYINTGALTVRASAASNSNILFKADASNHTVSLAGWTVDANSLYTGSNTSSTAPTIYIGNANIAKAVQIADSTSKSDWRLKINNNFGVDSSGNLYGYTATLEDVNLSGDILLKSVINGSVSTVGRINTAYTTSSQTTQQEVNIKSDSSMRIEAAAGSSLYLGNRSVGLDSDNSNAGKGAYIQLQSWNASDTDVGYIVFNGRGLILEGDMIGDTLPSAGHIGRIFFKRLPSSSSSGGGSGSSSTNLSFSNISIRYYDVQNDRTVTQNVATVTVPQASGHSGQALLANVFRATVEKLANSSYSSATFVRCTVGSTTYNSLTQVVYVSSSSSIVFIFER